MKITGVICEYNPFHNGHRHQLDLIKRDNDSHVICVMSGDFVQRGGPAITDKFKRAKVALQEGADVVIELPVRYSTGAARDFAYGAVSLLDSLGCVDELCYGSETPDSKVIEKIVSLICDDDNVKNQIPVYMKEGMSYPKARQLALSAYLDGYDYADAMRSNNILAIEYRVALFDLCSSIKPIAILRDGTDYNESAIKKNTLNSSCAIRKLLSGNNIDDDAMEKLSLCVPSSTIDMFSNSSMNLYAIFYKHFSNELRYKLITHAADGFDSYLDVSKDISDKIIKHLDEYESVDTFIESLVSKDITYARICRCLTHILLDIKSTPLIRAPYARLLGFREDSKEVLTTIKKNSSIPMISKLADAPIYLSGEAMNMLNEDILASRIYDMVAEEVLHQKIDNEYTKQIIIV